MSATQREAVREDDMTTATKAAHTPGPWHISDLDPRVVGPRRMLRDINTATQIGQLQAVARVCERLDETDANARLIAAAPDLLAALKDVERHCPCGARPESPHTHPHVGGCPVGDAIAKAEGLTCRTMSEIAGGDRRQAVGRVASRRT